jgi:2-amino-4-hydroxy-6-hydroxymethyldihydropteridine diphosphokinase
MSIVYIGLGTNLGDRQANLRAAVKALEAAVHVTAESRVYETPAWGYEDQPAFLNMAIQGETELAPTELLAQLKQLEGDLGRTATFRWGPRLIDMDILFYGQLMVDAPGLVIPHPNLQERAFVLVPLVEIAPDLVHPRLGETVRDLLKRVDASGIRPA